jgi:hypothetical protein
MRVYSVNYDLKTPGRDYTGLYEELKRSPLWRHDLESTWLIATNETAAQIWERIKGHIDGNDRVLIVQAGPDYFGWMAPDLWTWLKQKFTR